MRHISKRFAFATVLFCATALMATSAFAQTKAPKVPSVKSSAMQAAKKPATKAVTMKTVTKVKTAKTPAQPKDTSDKSHNKKAVKHNHTMKTRRHSARATSVKKATSSKSGHVVMKVKSPMPKAKPAQKTTMKKGTVQRK